jgi:pimeloyl-ACP methyl ester carboxylesterase
MTIAAFSPGFRDRNPGQFERYLNVKLRNRPEGLARLFQAFSVPLVAPDLSRVKCPVLLVVGENDPGAGPEQGRQSQQLMRGSTLVVLPTGHASAVELPDRFNDAVLNFLSSLRKS